MRKNLSALAAILVFCAHSLPAAAAEFYPANVDKFLNELAPHALRYPTNFDSKSQYDKYSLNLKDFLNQMDSALPNFRDDTEFLFQYSLANSMGHNMDIPGCAEKSISGFLRLLALTPNDRRANYYFGSFLSATTLYKKSPPFLLKAIELGEEDAHYTLAFVYIKEGKRSEALSEFKAYLKVNPDNETARKMVSDIEKDVLNVDVRAMSLQNK
jgi:tetratricopeptide (TPR) repeat protein